MNTPRPLCRARTQTGAPCRRYPQIDSEYCYVHRHLATVQPEAPVEDVGRDSAEPTPLATDQLRQILTELNHLTQELRRRVPDMTAARPSLSDLRTYLQDNFSQLASGLPGGFWQDLQNSFQGTTPQDLLKPETWQGLWYLANYTLQSQAEAMNENLAKRLSGLPAMDRLAALADNLPGPRPSRIFDPSTWGELLRATATTLQKQARIWQSGNQTTTDD